MGRRSRHGRLVALLGVVMLLACAPPPRLPAGPAAAAQIQPAPLSVADRPVSPAAPEQPQPADRPLIRALFVHTPTSLPSDRPAPVLLVLHGMGDSGPNMARDLVAEADRNGWLLVAPTIAYRDWRDPEQVRRDGAELLPALKLLVEELPARTGLSLSERVLMYGFSRGGQTAHRFALFYPELVERVASFSCGTYTLPSEWVRQGAEDEPLKFPYGVGDLAQYQTRRFNATAVRAVDFWIGVGGRDNQAAEVPRQWDPYLGTTRVERAQSFARALGKFGADATLAVFPDAAHEVTPEMRARAVAFLAESSS